MQDTDQYDKLINALKSSKVALILEQSDYCTIYTHDPKTDRNTIELQSKDGNLNYIFEQ